RPGHRAAQHECLGIEAFLRGPLDVRGIGRIVELVVGFGGPADRVIAIERRHGIEAPQIMNPLLDGDEARSSEAALIEDRGRYRVLTLRVLGTVLEAGEVATAVIR